MKSAAVIFCVRRHHRRPETLVDIGKLLPRALFMLQAIVRPCDRDAKAVAQAGKTLDVIKCFRTFHAKAIDDVKFLGVVHPGAQGGRERVPIAEVDADDPPRP